MPRPRCIDADALPRSRDRPQYPVPPSNGYVGAPGPSVQPASSLNARPPPTAPRPNSQQQRQHSPVQSQHQQQPSLNYGNRSPVQSMQPSQQAYGGSPAPASPQQRQGNDGPPPMSPAEPAPARGARRQYAANQGAYFAPEVAGGATQGGGGQHAHSTSQSAFFSPGDPAGVSAPYYPPTEGQYDQQGYPAQSQQQQQPMSAAYDGQQQQQASAGLAGQFGQMALGSVQPLQVMTSNLVGLALNPAELFGAGPPEIRLPPNVSYCPLARLTRPAGLTRASGSLSRPPFPPALMPTLIPRIKDRPLTRSRPIARCYLNQNCRWRSL